MIKRTVLGFTKTHFERMGEEEKGDQAASVSLSLKKKHKYMLL